CRRSRSARSRSRTASLWSRSPRIEPTRLLPRCAKPRSGEASRRFAANDEGKNAKIRGSLSREKGGRVISVSGVSMRFGSKILFEDVNATFSPRRGCGLTGPNGAGKSTFMKLLTGETPPQKGTVGRPEKVGVLRQDQFAFDQYRVIDTVIMGNGRRWKALEERERLYALTDMTDADGMRLAELEGIVGEGDGYSAESDCDVLLDGLDT